MLNKLSLRNAGRSMKDYAIYVMTMAMISTLMFAFNGMLFSQAIKDLLADITSMIVFLGMAAIFILIIVVWLTKYIINFMLERRSKEFGTYLLIGMTKKQVGKMFKREHIILGGVTFLLGIIPGYLLHVAFVNIFHSLYGVQYDYAMEFSIFTYLLTLAYYILAYSISLFKLNGKFAKMEIVDLVSMENKNEENEKGKISEKLIFLISILYIILFHVLVYTGIMANSFVVVLIVGLALAIYGVFIGLSSFLTAYIKKGNANVNRQANIFIFRQLGAKVKTMRFTMGTLTILFTVTILTWMSVLLFDGYKKEAFDTYLMPIDVLYVSEQPKEDFADQIKTIAEYGEITEQYSYQIYHNNTTQLNDYMKTRVPSIYKDVYFGYDTVMALSDYNYLRQMCGYEAVSLKEGGYLIQATARLEETFSDYGKAHEFVIGDQTLSYQETAVIPFTQSGINGADYLIIVSDVHAKNLTPYYSVLAANITSDEVYAMSRALEKGFPYLDEDGEMDATRMQIQYGYGSEQIISLGDPVIIREDLIRDYTNNSAAISFALGYIGTVFLVVAMSILAIQQLSDASKYKYRYQILKNLGVNQRQKSKIIMKQLGLYYMLPVVMSILISLFSGIFLSSTFVKYTGLLNTFGPQYYLVAVALFLVLFFIYYIMTYISFVRMVER